VAEYEWRDSDPRDLVRRDMVQLLRRGSPAIAASGVLALWLRSTAPRWAAMFLGMSVAWLISVAIQAKDLRARWGPYAC
jgi:hypothetical protein